MTIPTLAAIADHLYQLAYEAETDHQQLDAIMQAHPEMRSREYPLFNAHAMLGGLIGNIRRTAREVEAAGRGME